MATIVDTSRETVSLRFHKKNSAFPFLYSIIGPLYLW
jgi:hypothetical protein